MDDHSQHEEPNDRSYEPPEVRSLGSVEDHTATDDSASVQDNS